MSWLVTDKALVEERLADLLPDRATPLEQAMRYSVLAPAKRIRSLLMLRLCRYFDQPVDRALDVACAIEMIHAASLVIDDMPCMDDDAMRRDQSATHAKYGEATAILAAISLLTRSYDTVAQAALEPNIRFEIIRLLSDTVGPNGLSLGQQIDLDAKDTPLALQDIAEIHHLKTGVLFVAAARIACLTSHATPDQHQAVATYTFHLGMAFQIYDDIKDSGALETNITTSISLTDAIKTCQHHLDTAKQAIAGRANAVLLNDFIDVFFQFDKLSAVHSA
jgi:geranylgeranyl diphosphate synthase type II